MTTDPEAGTASVGTVGEVAVAFLKLGLTSFGGPIAHLGYFHREFVERRGWMDEQQFGHLVGLCQFLPGPASSQVGFSLGLVRGGWLGGLAAFVGFTLPSALFMVAFATLSARLHSPLGLAAIHGLKIVAVAVVAQGLYAMAPRLAPDRARVLIAAASAAWILASHTAATQLGVVMGSALAGLWLCREVEPVASERIAVGHGKRVGCMLLGTFIGLLVMSFAVPPSSPGLLQASAAFYRAGALVFGGGHVVLPLLQHEVVGPGWVSKDVFLAGYGAAQAVPGPMFSFAAFLGDQLDGGRGGLLGAIVAVIGIFLPGLLLVAGALPFWHALAKRKEAGRMLAGVNAGVVGLLAAALYDPVWVSAVRSPDDVAVAVVGFVMLVAARWSPLVVVAWCVLASVARQTIV